MYNRQRAYLWVAAAMSFVVGLIFVLNDSVAGWIFFIFGIIYLGVSARPGQLWATSKPGLVRWGLVGIALLFVLLVVVIGAAFLMK